MMDTIPTYIQPNEFQSQRLKKRKRRRLIKLLIYVFVGVIGIYFLFNSFIR
jgi:multisubunit Na+/H+ antiporter MnhB subunit